MRLPMKENEVDLEEFSRMTDEFISSGFNYFDTAHGYIGGKSETAIRECLVKRYDRSEYILTNKLSSNFFNTREEIMPLFEQQLKACGVDYFDFYLMHAQMKKSYDKYKRVGAYEESYRLKEKGLIKHFGISFHDRAEVLDTILTEHPEIEIVQIQFNYFDYQNPSVDSKRVYEVCEKHGKPVIVMEPVKGGSLVNVGPQAQKIFDDLQGGSNASYAIRFAAGFSNIAVVLSGMSDLEQMKDNVSYMKDPKPLNDIEIESLNRVTEMLKSQNHIPCTSCKYCIDDNKCPKDIRIPEIFSAMNAFESFHDWNARMYYSVTTDGHGKASDCIKCGACERICPQHLKIRELLQKGAEMFEKK